MKKKKIEEKEKEYCDSDREALYREYYDTIAPKDKNRREVSIKQLNEAIKIKNEWDNTFGKEYEEKFKDKLYSRNQIDDFLKRADPLFKKLLKSQGIRICEAELCTNIIPDRRRKFCTDECKNKAKSKKWSTTYPSRKLETLMRHYASKKHEIDGVNEAVYEKVRDNPRLANIIKKHT